MERVLPVTHLDFVSASIYLFGECRHNDHDLAFMQHTSNDMN